MPISSSPEELGVVGFKSYCYYYCRDSCCICECVACRRSGRRCTTPLSSGTPTWHRLCSMTALRSTLATCTGSKIKLHYIAHPYTCVGAHACKHIRYVVILYIVTMYKSHRVSTGFGSCLFPHQERLWMLT